MAVMFRAIVMLVVLVGLPAAWVYYGPLPPAAQQVVDRAVEVVKDAVGWEQALEDETEIGPVAPPQRFAVAPASYEAPIQTVGPTDDLNTQAKPLLEQLRSMGATEYQLQQWGGQGQFYRFRCSMSLAEGEQLTQQFEAITDNPLVSIEQVVGEVTAWRSTGPGGRFH